MEKTIRIPEEQIEIAGEYDVIVVGGGVAGIGAALAAARCGSRVLILEKSVMMGGLATLGLVTEYHPICDGKGRRIIGGISEELLHLAIRYSYNTLPDAWKSRPDHIDGTQRYRTRFSPAEFVMAIDELLEAEKIDFVFDTVFSVPVMEQDTCRAVVVEEKGGRRAYTARMFVDATGDCDLMRRAGASAAEGDNWVSYWCYTADTEHMAEAAGKNRVMTGINLTSWGDGLYKEHPAYPKMVLHDARDITQFILRGRRCVLDGIRDLDHATHAVTAIPGMAQTRTTYRLEGEYTLCGQDAGRHFDDSVGSVCEWRRVGPSYEIPYRCLITGRLKNVITAGRCISSAGDAWEITRVIPPAVLTGQAAGTAAAMAVKEGKTLHEIRISKLQERLGRDGVMIHF